MKFLEKDLEEIIYYSDSEELSQRGLTLEDGFLLRQVEIPNHGIADLINYVRPTKHKDYHEANIIELKRDEIDEDAFIQSLKYAQGIRTLFLKKGLQVKIKITLIGKSVDTKSDFVYAPHLFSQDNCLMKVSSINFYTYEYKLSGLLFDLHENYYRIEKTKSNKTKCLSCRTVKKIKLDF